MGFPVNVHLNQSIDILLQQTRCMMVFWLGKFNDSTIFLMGISGAFFIKPSHWGSSNGHWMMVWGLFFVFLRRKHIQLHAYVYIYNWEYSQYVWDYVGYATIIIRFYISITYIWEYSHYTIGNIPTYPYIMVISAKSREICGLQPTTTEMFLTIKKPTFLDPRNHVMVIFSAWMNHYDSPKDIKGTLWVCQNSYWKWP